MYNLLLIVGNTEPFVMLIKMPMHPGAHRLNKTTRFPNYHLNYKKQAHRSSMPRYPRQQEL